MAITLLNSPANAINNATLGQPTVMTPRSDVPEGPETNEVLAARAQVKHWQSEIKKDKAWWKNDFDRMRRNMDFVSSLQWKGQNKIEEENYIANWTLQRINQKVATLYARNPRTVVSRRKKLNFSVWDGKMETIQQAVGAAMMGMQQMGAPPPAALELMNDFQRGRQYETLMDNVGKTLEILYQYQQDSQEPDFKVQAKQFVRRVSVCGVGYIKVLFVREDESQLTYSDRRQVPLDRLKMAQEILQQIVDGKVEETDAEMQRLQELLNSSQTSLDDHENTEVKERLVFDFPPATAIIPDRRTRILKGFVGAQYITEEFIYSLDDVNAKYGTNITAGGELKEYNADGTESEVPVKVDEDSAESPLVCLWQVYNLKDKSTFIICDGWKDYVQAPEVMTPAPKSFWTIFPLTFNDVETEPGCKNKIFPPSDVDLMRPIQQEWNRTRQALREQRKANAPKYMTPKGMLSEKDKDAIEMARDNQVIELENLPPGTDPGKVVVPLQVAKIDPEVYDTRPLEEDAMLVTAMQEANIGAAQPNVTATVGSIAEQSRQTISSSNVDDLDDCLSAVARCGGELLLMEMSATTVQRIVGIGAVWPTASRADFLNEISLEIESASSGRPNKALELANFEKVGPFLLQFGANPMAVIRELLKRLDDKLDPADFYPVGLGPMQPQQPQEGEPQQLEQGPQGPPPGPPFHRPSPQHPVPVNDEGQGQMYPPPVAA